jgi:hypothetical protein
MKRGMGAVLLLVLLSPATWGATHWYRYQGTFSWNWRSVTGEINRDSAEFYVLLCYETTPGSISIEGPGGVVYMSGEFDRETTKLQFRASEPSGQGAGVGRGTFNAAGTTLNLQGSTFSRAPGARSYFGQIHFRGAYLDYITKP